MLAAAKVSKTEWEAAQSKEATTAQIKTLLDEASALKPANKWADVIQKYEQALALDTERSDVSSMLAAAKVSKTEWEAAQSQGEEFAQLKLSGNELLAQEKWNDAKAKYESALQIKADTEIDASIKIIEKKLAEIAASKNKEEEYNSKMSIAEEFASSEKYQQALTSFNEALSVKEGDATAKGRIKDMQEKLDALAQAESKNKKYSDAMSLGNTAMASKDYPAAVKAFEDALIEIPADAQATRMKKEARDKVIELQEEEAEYNSFIASALAKYDEALADNSNISKLKEAKIIFGSAQNIRPQAPLPQSKIVEIDNLIRKIEEDAAASNQAADIDKRYQDQLQLANVAAQGGKYKNAIEYLKEAQKIKPQEAFPTTEILRLQTIIDNASAQKELEANYTSLIAKADLAFDNKKYENSIQLYNDALKLKENENYPKAQISKVQEAIANNADNLKTQEYQNFMNKADAQFLNKEFENALTNYKSALSVKENDPDAKDKIDEIQQILDNILKAKRDSETQKQRFDQFIADADQLFKGEKYLEASSVYKQALGIDANDAYAIQQVRISIEKGKEKDAQNKELRYKQSIGVADQFFQKEEYDRAIVEYKRAMSIKPLEQYPKTQLAKIEAIKNTNVKAQGSVEYIGEQSNISILEGAALLQEGEIQRGRLKQEAVLNRLSKFEGEEEDRSLSDFEERLAFENEVTFIKDKREQSFLKDIVTKRQIADEVDSQLLDFEKTTEQMSRFKDGELSRASQELVFVLDEFDQENADYRALHKDAIERIKEIENHRSDKDATELAHHDVKVTAVNEELTKIDTRYDDFIKVNEAFQQETERQVNIIKDARDARTVIENNDEYIQLLSLQDEAVLAEMKVAESTKEKDLIQQQLKEDLIVYEAELQRKFSEEASVVHLEQMKINDLVAGAEKQYLVAQDGKDDARLLAVEKLKAIEQEQLDQTRVRSDEKKERTEEIYLEVEAINEFQTERSLQNIKDLTVVDKDVTNRLSNFERARALQASEEIKQHQLTENELLRIDNNEEVLRGENIENIKEIYKEVTNVESQYVKTQDGKDDSRLLAVEKLKAIEQEQLDQTRVRSDEKKDRTEEIYLEVEAINEFQTERSLQNIKDLTVVDNDVTNRLSNFERARALQASEEVRQHHKTENELLRIEKNEELSRSENIENIKENYEELKGQQTSIEDRNLNIGNASAKQKQETQKYVDGLENNSVKFDETIANTIGDDYPEGVTQENYVRNDSQGIPIRIVTRRIVVTDGRGEVYIRTQTRNGLTYSKNGSPITEQNWINGTENAKLEKHY